MCFGLFLSGLGPETHPQAPEYHEGSLPLSVLEDKPRTLYAQMLPGDQTFRFPVTQFPYLVSMVIQCWQVSNNTVFLAARPYNGWLTEVLGGICEGARG